MTENVIDQQAPVSEDKTQDQLKFLGDFSKRVMSAENPAVNSMFIEFDALQDFRLGALLGMIKTDAEYSYLLKCIKEYNESYDLRIARYFPSLGFTEEDIDNFLKDQKHSHFLSIASPMRKFFYRIPEIFRQMQDRRQMSPDTRQMEITFHTSNLHLSKLGQAKWKLWLHKYFGNIKLRFTGGTSIGNMPERFFEQFDFLLIDDPISFMAHPGIDKGIEEEKYTMKTVWASRIYDHENFHPENEDELKEGINKYEVLVNLICNYYSFDRTIATGKMNNG